MITNGIALIVELGDIRFFAFGMKRSTLNLMDQSGDLLRLLPRFLTDFWYLVVIFFFLMTIMGWLYKKTLRKKLEFHLKPVYQIVITLFAAGFLFILARGGIQSRPLMPISAVDLVKHAALAPLITNTTLHLVHSFQQRSIKEPRFLSRDKLMDIYPILHDPTSSDTLLKQENVVIILLESFGKEVMGRFNPGKQGSTPFLDSLMGEGLYFEHSFANGTRSNQAVFSILTGIPSMMPDPFMISKYQGNSIEAFPELLAQEGYSTAFFHGGNNGTFHFDNFSVQAGFQAYYGRSEYGRDKDFDGNWGVFDKPFFNYTLNQVNNLEPPFCALLFSLTSHHPYTVEAGFEKRFPEMDPLKRSILYTDEALKEFFQRAAKSSWFDNTLFIITADHIGRIQDPSYSTAIGHYKVPILFYKSDGSLKKQVDDVIQHIDIMPTILDYLDYPKPYLAFGRSALKEDKPRYAFTSMGGYAQILDKELLLRHSGQRVIALHEHNTDTLLRINKLGEYTNDSQRLNEKLMAVWQLHHHTMIYNKLTVDSWRKWK